MWSHLIFLVGWNTLSSGQWSFLKIAPVMIRLSVHQKTLSRLSRKKQNRSYLIKFLVCVEAWKQLGERWRGVVWRESEKAWPEKTPYSLCVWGRQNKQWFSYPRFGGVLMIPWKYPGMTGEGPRRFTAPSKNQTGWVLISFVNSFFSKIYIQT